MRGPWPGGWVQQGGTGDGLGRGEGVGRTSILGARAGLAAGNGVVPAARRAYNRLEHGLLYGLLHCRREHDLLLLFVDWCACLPRHIHNVVRFICKVIAVRA